MTAGYQIRRDGAVFRTDSDDATAKEVEQTERLPAVEYFNQNLKCGELAEDHSDFRLPSEPEWLKRPIWKPGKGCGANDWIVIPLFANFAFSLECKRCRKITDVEVRLPVLLL